MNGQNAVNIESAYLTFFDPKQEIKNSLETIANKNNPNFENARQTLLALGHKSFTYLAQELKNDELKNAVCEILDDMCSQAVRVSNSSPAAQKIFAGIEKLFNDTKDPKIGNILQKIKPA